MKKTKSGLPMIDQTQLVKVLNIAKENGKGVLVLGLPGIGKTTIIRNWIKENYTQTLSIFETEATKLSTDYTIYGPKLYKDLEIPGNKLPFINKLPFFIDDIGTEKPATHFGSQVDLVEHIILTMYTDGKQPFFATSNLDLNQIQERYGVRIVERLKEMCIIVVLDGPNYRDSLFQSNQDLLSSL
jgi:DNA replication protein DnaC